MYLQGIEQYTLAGTRECRGREVRNYRSARSSEIVEYVQKEKGEEGLQATCVGWSDPPNPRVQSLMPACGWRWLSWWMGGWCFEW